MNQKTIHKKKEYKDKKILTMVIMVCVYQFFL